MINEKPDHTNKIEQLYIEADALKNSKPEQALEMARQAYAMALEEDNYEFQYKSLSVTGWILLQTGRLDEALELFQKGLNVVKTWFQGNKRFLAHFTNSIGVAYKQLGVMELALDYYLKALQYGDESLSNEVYNNLGAFYGERGENEKARKYFQICLDNAHKDHLISREIRYSINVAKANLQLGEVEKCEQLLEKVDRLMQEDEAHPVNPVALIITYELHARVAIHKNDVDKALAFYDRSLEVAKSKGSKRLYAYQIGNKGRCLLDNDQEEAGLACINEALEISEAIGTGNIRSESLEHIINYYEAKGMHAEAYPYLKELQQLSSKKLVESREENFARIIRQREKEINVLENKNREIEAHNAVLEQFAFIISHDLREPVRTIVSFANLIERDYSALMDPRGKSYLGYVNKGAITLKNKWTRLLEFVRIRENEPGRIAPCRLKELIPKIVEAFTPKVLPGNLIVDYPEVDVGIEEAHIEMLFNELIGNAVQFRKPGGDSVIKINCEQEKNKYHFVVSDNGIGIRKEYIPNLLNMFRRVDVQSTDNVGAGLAICQRIVQLYHGEIWIESVLGESTTVHFTLSAN